MGDPVFIGIDLGTSGVRVETYSSGGDLLYLGRAEFRRQGVEVWLAALKESVQGLLSKSPGGSARITVDSTSGSFILCDERGAPLHPPVMYYEKAVKGYSRVKDLDSARTLGSKGVKLSPTSPISKLVELRGENPELFSRVRWVLPPATWLLYRLRFREGEPWRDLEVDYSNALKFGLDITGSKPDWFEPLFEEAGIPLDIFPRVVESGKHIGPAESKLAESLGFKGAELYHGMTDGNAAALASGALKEGDFTIYSGSTTVPKYVASELKPHPAIYYHVHPISGYLAGAATSATGGMITWLSEKVFGIPVSEAFKLMERVEPGGEPLFFPPGDRSPFNDPLMGAALLGLWPREEDRETIIGRLVLSAAVGIAFLEYSYIKVFEELFGRRIPEVKMSGGGTRSALWNRLRASIYERRVKVYGDQIAVGALVPVIVRNGLYKSLDEVEKTFLQVRAVVEPDAEIAEKYREARDAFMDRWSLLRKVYHLGS